MKNRKAQSTVELRLDRLRREIAENERRQRRLQQAMEKGKPLDITVTRAPAHSPPPPPPSAPLGHDHPVRFTEDNASIFMSGNLEELRVRSASPAERRNRRLLLAVFAAAILVGVLYILLNLSR